MKMINSQRKEIAELIAKKMNEAADKSEPVQAVRALASQNGGFRKMCLRIQAILELGSDGASRIFTNEQVSDYMLGDRETPIEKIIGKVERNFVPLARGNEAHIWDKNLYSYLDLKENGSTYKWVSSDGLSIFGARYLSYKDKIMSLYFSELPLTSKEYEDLYVKQVERFIVPIRKAVAHFRSAQEITQKIIGALYGSKSSTEFTLAFPQFEEEVNSVMNKAKPKKEVVALVDPKTNQCINAILKGGTCA